MAFNGTLVEFAVPSGEIEGQHLLYSTTVNAISISPNSQTVATTREGMVQIWNLAAAGASNFIDEPAINFDTDRGTYTQAFVDVRWINSDEFITIETTYSDYDSSVFRSISRRNANTGDETEQIYRYEGDYDAASPEYNCGSHPSWDYSRFACVVSNYLRIYTFDLRTILLSIPMDHIRDIEWGPDNTVLALRRYIEATTSYIIEIRRVGDGELLYTVDADGRHTAPVWNYDLSLLAIPVSVDGNPSIQIVNTQTYEVVDTIVAEQALWHPTDNLLALNDNTSLKFWTPSASTLNAEVEISGITAFDWSDSGQFIVTAGNDGTIRLWGVVE